MAHDTSDATTVWQKLKAGVPADGDGPVAAVFRCADAGISSEKVFGQPAGALLDVSTWGTPSTPACSPASSTQSKR